MDVKRISKNLRKGKSQQLEMRRKIALLSSLGLVDFIIISLYQLGVIKRLPDINVKYFDSNYVNASEEAYKMGVPDGPVSALVYSGILVLIGAKGRDEEESKDIWDYMLGGAIGANAIGAAQYLLIMFFKQKRVCLYCIGGAIINFIMLRLYLKLLRIK